MNPRQQPFSAFSLQRERQQLQRINEAVYEPVMRVVINMIKEANRQNRTEIYYSVPLLRPMHPQYKFEDCIEYLKSKLEAMYFLVTRGGLNYLAISWQHVDAIGRNSNAFDNPKSLRLVWNR